MTDTQHADVQGHGNIVVQAKGSNIEVNVHGLPHLQLIQPQWRSARITKRTDDTIDLTVLNAYVQSIPLVGPYLAQEVAESAAGEAGKAVFEWLKEKLTGAAAQETIEDLAKDPESETNRQGLEVAVKKALQQDEGFREELAKLLQQYGDQIAKVQGNANKVVQAQGKNTNIG
jgi:ribosomal protein S11